MPQLDEIAALGVKLDFAMAELKSAREEIASLRTEVSEMRSDFDQSKGALRLVKWSAAVAASAATLWALMHGAKP